MNKSKEAALKIIYEASVKVWGYSHLCPLFKGWKRGLPIVYTDADKQKTVEKTGYTIDQLKEADSLISNEERNKVVPYTMQMTVGSLKKQLADCADDMPICLSFNGCTNSGELLAVTEIDVVSANHLIEYDEQSDEEVDRLKEISVLHLYSNRHSFEV